MSLQEAVRKKITDTTTNINKGLNTMPKIELLAPAGNFDCLVAAVQSGADAVYFAGKKFGARNFADNFDSDELEKAVDYCHLRNTSVYVTVNTLVTDPEIEELKEYLCFLARIGVDTVIVQDLGVAEIVRTVVPELPIHASTQMTIHNLSGVNFLKKYNIRRVVLSRELSLDDIRNISANSDVELEVFAHGALCMCYSGQCLLFFLAVFQALYAHYLKLFQALQQRGQLFFPM